MKKALEDGRCVVDMEYMVKKEPSRFERLKPDIVAFDQNNGFRFIKLKYADNGSGKNSGSDTWISGSGLITLRDSITGLF